MTNVSFGSTILSFGHASKDEKKIFLRKNSDKHIYMDLTCFDPAEFYSEFPQLKGSFAALFCDEEKRIEFHSKESNDTVLGYLRDLGYKPTITTIVSCGFIFPRTIVQIINEAHFALAEKVASREDIDRAMKFGVNYPKGPFEWSRNREDAVLTLLDELYQKTHDKRYVASAEIKKAP
jgi:3-hydroxybutyryl-CoA dehydrogenase